MTERPGPCAVRPSSFRHPSFSFVIRIPYPDLAILPDIRPGVCGESVHALELDPPGQIHLGRRDDDVPAVTDGLDHSLPRDAQGGRPGGRRAALGDLHPAA